MASVIFLRAVNVGGRTMRPKAFAQAHGLVNVGAAGTFVSPDPVAGLATSIRSLLPFDTEVFVCAGAQLTRLVRREPFAGAPAATGVKHYVSILGRTPKSPPALPLSKPKARLWEVRVLEITGRFALSCWHRRDAKKLLYPNEVVEREIGVPATTRGWPTLLQISAVLDGK